MPAHIGMNMNKTALNGCLIGVVNCRRRSIDAAAISQTTRWAVNASAPPPNGNSFLNELVGERPIKSLNFSRHMATCERDRRDGRLRVSLSRRTVHEPAVIEPMRSFHLSTVINHHHAASGDICQQSAVTTESKTAISRQLRSAHSWAK